MTERAKESQKRSDYRSGITYPVWYRGLPSDQADGEWARSRTLDLSGGGASFELIDQGAHSYQVGDVLELQVILPPSPVFGIAKIVRLFLSDGNRLCAAVMFACVTS